MSKQGCRCANYANGRCIGEGDCELRKRVEELELEAFQANIPHKKVIAIVAENVRLRTALEFYADKEEWCGKPREWALLFNSGSVDGHGWEVADKALKEAK